MNRDQVIQRLRAHESEFRDRGVVGLALFGSLARGEAAAGSDVDVVVDLEPRRKFSIIDHGSLRVRLCEIVGNPTEVVIRARLRPAFRDRIEADSIPVF